MTELCKPVFLKRDVKVWIRRPDGSSKLLRIAPRFAPKGNQRYELFNAFEPNIKHFGRVLFDTNFNWIYDGDSLHIEEQEYLAKFIIDYMLSLQNKLTYNRFNQEALKYLKIPAQYQPIIMPMRFEKK